MPNQYTCLPMPARFWANVDTNGPSPAHRPKLGSCWLWTRRPVGNGYGQFRFEGRSRPAHVVAWILTNGPINAGVFVCHHCDVRRCVRPGHLFLGDQAVNMADMVAKQRGPLGVRNGKYTQPERTPRGDRYWTAARRESLPRGSRHPNAKLTEAIVAEARARYSAGGLSVESLAAWAGVSKPTMARVINGTTWRHVPARAHPQRARLNFIGAHQQRQRLSPSSIERALMDALNAAGIPYEIQYVVGDRFLCDFAFPEARLIVETDGTYWHRTALQKKRDASKDAYLRACGFTVLRLTEEQVRQHLTESLRAIRALLNRE